MTVYFGSSTDDELIAELRQRGYCAVKHEEAQAANKLAAKEISHLVSENFGRVPRDAWADTVLNLRDSTEDQPPPDNARDEGRNVPLGQPVLHHV